MSWKAHRYGSGETLQTPCGEIRIDWDDSDSSCKERGGRWYFTVFDNRSKKNYAEAGIAKSYALGAAKRLLGQTLEIIMEA